MTESPSPWSSPTLPTARHARWFRSTGGPRERPVRLVGYAVADEMVPGEERTVTVACDPRAFRLWNEAASDWDAPSGGTFLIARGLGDIRLEIPRS